MKRRARALLLAMAVASVGGAAACGSDEVYRVPVAGSPQQGPDDAWVTVVEFADFECPYCAQAATTVHQMLLGWPAADLRVVYKHFPLYFHSRARPAAVAAECAHQQGRFWDLYDELYSGVAGLEDAALEQDAARAGVDLERWRSCLASDAPQRRIDEDLGLGQDLEVEGTPTFFINGVRIEGALPFEDFRAVIDREMEKAKLSGVERARYYERVVLGDD